MDPVISSLPPQPSMKPWYRTGPGITFLVILGIIGFVILSFSILTGYYLWQIKSGRGAELGKAFAKEKLTLDKNRAAQTAPTGPKLAIGADDFVAQ